MKTLLNIICLKKVKYSLFIIILLLLYIIVSAISYSIAISNDLQNSVFRLHVIANSDSQEDQNLKYLVRDDLIQYMNELCKDIKSRDEAIILAKEHLADFRNLAKKSIVSNGYNYDVNVDVGNYFFPTKSYGDISLPAGTYEALRVEIGEASGQNWWCVMFPPLCFISISSGIIDDNSKHILEEELSDEEFSLISSNSPDIRFKFKIIELLQSTNILTAKK